jgi:hypothetical protein
MQGLLDKIEQAFREFYLGLIESNLTTMFIDVNEKTATIAEQIGQTPQGWNGNIFSMITEENNLHDEVSFSFFKYFLKMWVAVFLVTHTFDIHIFI